MAMAASTAVILTASRVRRSLNMAILSHTGRRGRHSGILPTQMPHPALSFAVALTLALALALANARAGTAAAQARMTEARLSEPQVRDLVARQERAWNAGDLAAWAATYAPGAVFTDQALGSDNRIVPYGQSRLPEALAQARRTLRRSKVEESVRIRRVSISADGRGAAALADVRTRIETRGAVRWSCAERLESMALVRGRLKTVRQTDTLVRCRRAP